ncbi:receptor-type tyrosine-protein phosphatase eta-like [Dreissena polymorpha]|uniref:receptor-type tyrosine-protein phosphatase eta-like n=1 Tax=Dreissena polymorpha TaxID=45954 RepID=UPI0022642FEF|nr:receptor-type tyrosine-protein phosphatase eta-like [Dreissena polymorpha]
MQVTTTTMTVSWIVPAGKELFINAFDVALTQVTGGVLARQQRLSGASRSATTSGLTPGRAYTVMVTSVNNQTQDQSERTISITSKQATKPDPPTKKSIEDSDVLGNDKTISFSWNASAGFAQGYLVSVTNFTSPTQSHLYTGTSAQIFDSRFKNGATYIIQIVSLSERVDTKPDQESEPLLWPIKTDVQVPTAPLNIICIERMDTSIKLAWSSPLEPNGDLVRYNIEAKSSNSSVNVSTPGVTDTFIVSGLSPGAYYAFYVYTENEKYKSVSPGISSGGPDACKTKAKLSEAPQNLLIETITSRSINVTWIKPFNTYSKELLGYVLQAKALDAPCVQHLYVCSNCASNLAAVAVDELCTNSENDTQPKEVLKGNQIANVRGLLPDTVYTITVDALNDAGRGHRANLSVRTSEEEPQAVPADITVSDIQKTSFNVSWSLVGPRPGQVTYTLSLTPDEGAPAKSYPVYGYTNTSVVVSGLEEYWNYTVTVSARTGVGMAKISPSTQSYRTLPSAPGPVSYFAIIVAKNRSDDYRKLTVDWKAPSLLDKNSIIKEYVLSHNVTTVIQHIKRSDDGSQGYRHIFDVLPETMYTFTVYAVNTETNEHDGVPTTKTVTAPAGVPKVVVDETNAPVVKQIAVEQTTITLNISEEFMLDETNGQIKRRAIIGCRQDKCQFDVYRTSVVWQISDIDRMDKWETASANGYTLWRITNNDWWSKGTSGRQRRNVDSSTNTFTVGSEICTSTQDNYYCNGPLSAETSYVFVVAVCTSGGCLLSQDYGPYRTKAVPDDKSNVGMIVGIVVGCSAALIIIIIVIVFLRRRRSKKPTTHFSGGDIDILEEKVVKNRPIRLSEFNTYLATMKRDSNLKFSSEYEDLKTLSPKFSTDASDMEENRPKNRYINIIPFDSTRVKLSTDGNDDSDYINANFLPGYNSPREYIGCQGPLAATVDDMWRMIWEQNVSIIVMLTLCTEGNKNKCEQYWPDTVNEPKQYGEVVVEVTSRSTINHYDLRMMKISNGKQKRELKHFHFLTWHDYKADVHHNVMLNFISRVRESMRPPDSNKPTLVHCSAGVGRTGTYIAVDHLMQFIRDHDYEEQIDIFDLVLKLRHNRSHMVQTEQQYIFIHECVKEMLDEKMKAHDNLYANVGGDDNLYANTQQESLYENTFTGKTREEKTEL